MSSTPTPLDDNRLNRNDESMYNAIDKMMSNSEQSYDDFMKGFTHLKTEDLESKQKANKEELQKPPHGNPESAEEITLDPEVRPKNTSVTHSQEEENELQEVVLEPGIICGWMNKAGSQSGTVQLDNFIGDHSESENSDLEDLTSGYTASFTMEKAFNNTANQGSSEEIQARKDAEPESKSEPADMGPILNKQSADADTNKHSESGSNKDSETEDIPDAQESIDAMKNILLETFLSDFCEEMGLGGMEGMGFGAMSGMNFDESEEQLETDNVEFDDDHLDLLLNITDTGASGAKEYVKDSISKSTDSEPVPKTKKKSRSRRRKKNKAQKSEQNMNKNEDQNTTVTLEQNMAKNKDQNTNTNRPENAKSGAGNKTESESNVCSSDNSNIVSTEQKSNLTVDKFSGSETYDKESEVIPADECSVDPNSAQNDNESTEMNENDFSGKLLFPGEVDPDETATAVSTETKLEFKATYRELPEDTTIEQSCSNEVETFVLDENFDYDNVVLTPKYSPEDMERISALMMGKVTL